MDGAEGLGSGDRALESLEIPARHTSIHTVIDNLYRESYGLQAIRDCASHPITNVSPPRSKAKWSLNSCIRHRGKCQSSDSDAELVVRPTIEPLGRLSQSTSMDTGTA